MSSHRKLHQKNSLRYHSEDSLGIISKAKGREGAHSIQTHYSRQNNQQNTTDLLLNEEDISIPDLKPLGLRDNLLTLPKINPKSTAKHSHRMLTQKSLLRKQLPIFSCKASNLSLSNSMPQSSQPQYDYVYATHQGTRIKNQDRISIQILSAKEKLYQYFAVFDGHGGHLTSTYLSNQLHIVIQAALNQGESPENVLRSSLKTVEERLKKNQRLSHRSGSCAVICLLSGQECWVANVGDSRIISIGQNSQVCQISRDHKPEDQIQRKRIEYNGGEVYRNRSSLEQQLQNKRLPFRVYPGKLSVSRTIGDIGAKKQKPQVIISDPDVYSFPLKKISSLLLFSDGVYETMTNKQISSYFLSLRPQAAITELFDEALKRKSQDNRSLIAIKIQE